MGNHSRPVTVITVQIPLPRSRSALLLLQNCITEPGTRGLGHEVQGHEVWRGPGGEGGLGRETQPDLAPPLLSVVVNL